MIPGSDCLEGVPVVVWYCLLLTFAFDLMVVGSTLSALPALPAGDAGEIVVTPLLMSQVIPRMSLHEYVVVEYLRLAVGTLVAVVDMVDWIHCYRCRCRLCPRCHACLVGCRVKALSLYSVNTHYLELRLMVLEKIKKHQAQKALLINSIS